MNEQNKLESLNTLRSQIDNIDGQILNLINQRLQHAIEIGKIKAQSGNRVLDSARETSLLNRLLELNTGPLKKDALFHIYKEIIAASREIQTPQKVSYLGPEATFTHIAAMQHFGHSTTFIPKKTIRDIFIDVEKGACEYGIVPAENSIEGTIDSTLDLFFETDVSICAERFQTISHDLLSNAFEINKIKVVYAPTRALAQCREWLRKYLPSADIFETKNTAMAAQKANKNEHAAAIASGDAAHMYGLQVLVSKIEDSSRNMTRFLIVGKNSVKPTGQDKTSIMFVTSHSPGALHRAIQPMADAQLNMLKLESRPTKRENWNYFFFVDVEGHTQDQALARTIDKMREPCLFLKVLGSYPSGQIQ